MGTIHITLVANAGLLLESGGRKLLLDGLHSQENGMFSPVPPCIREQIMKRIPPFDGIRWVAFTHFHEDHFDLDLVNRYLQEAAPEMLVMPEDTPNGVSSKLKAGVCSTEAIELPMGQCRSIRLWETGSLAAFPSRHAGREYETASHLCYVLEADGKKVLILGDSDYDSVFFKQMAGAMEFDAVIANPLFLHLPRGRRVFTQSIRTKEIIFCHLPFAEDDQIHFRNMMSEDMRQYETILPPMKALTDPLQKVSI